MARDPLRFFFLGNDPRILSIRGSVAISASSALDSFPNAFTSRPSCFLRPLIKPRLRTRAARGGFSARFREFRVENNLEKSNTCRTAAGTDAPKRKRPLRFKQTTPKAARSSNPGRRTFASPPACPPFRLAWAP
eukprot:1193520-Prorocentrum_minimum.AAC.7